MIKTTAICIKSSKYQGYFYISK